VKAEAAVAANGEVKPEATGKAPRAVQTAAQQRQPEQKSVASDSVAQNARGDMRNPAQDVDNFLTTARGTITAGTQAKPAVAANSDVKAEAAVAANGEVKPDATGKAPRAAQTAVQQRQPEQKPVTGDNVAQNAHGDVRNPAQDAGDPRSEDARKANPGSAEPAQPALPQSVSQTVATTNPAVPALAPNAANATAATSASATPQRPALNDAQGADQPKIAALATAIAAKSAAGTKTFEIRMDPPELGRVDVHLSVDRDGKVQAMLSAEHPRTLELLQRDSQHLERALKDAGLNLSNNSLNFSLKGEGRQGDGGGASMARARSLPDAVVARAEAANASVSNFNTASGDGRLDIRV
jgi:flagellar hook-length control protein FliK